MGRTLRTAVTRTARSCSLAALVSFAAVASSCSDPCALLSPAAMRPRCLPHAPLLRAAVAPPLSRGDATHGGGAPRRCVASAASAAPSAEDDRAASSTASSSPFWERLGAPRYATLPSSIRAIVRCGRWTASARAVARAAARERSRGRSCAPTRIFRLSRLVSSLRFDTARPAPPSRTPRQVHRGADGRAVGARLPDARAALRRRRGLYAHAPLGPVTHAVFVAHPPRCSRRRIHKWAAGEKCFAMPLQATSRARSPAR